MPRRVGRVFRDEDRGVPIEGALIRFDPEADGPNRTVRSGPNGSYTINLPDGRYVMAVEHPGYAAFTTAPGFVVVSADGNPTTNAFLKAGDAAPDLAQAIQAKWRSMGGDRSPVGPVRHAAVSIEGGAMQRFAHGSVLAHRRNGRTEAFAVWGAIHEKWMRLGAADGEAGFPRTDETKTPDGEGRFNHFDRGSIYWTPRTGARFVMGAIRGLWSELGWEAGWLGYPRSSERATPPPKEYGRYTLFEHGSIYWTPTTGAIALPKVVVEAWGRHGHERGDMGFPVPKQWGRNLAHGMGPRRDTKAVHLFEGGVIHETLTGARAFRHAETIPVRLDMGAWRKMHELNTDREDFDGAQGIAYRHGKGGDDRAWFVTRHSSAAPDADEVFRFDKHFHGTNRRRDVAAAFRTNHAGDIDLHEDTLYLACEQGRGAPSLFVGRLDLDLRALTKHELLNRDGLTPGPQKQLPWCAVNPTDRMLYSSDFDAVREVHGYDLSPSRDGRKTRPGGTAPGFTRSKTIRLPFTVDRVQGGAFSPNGVLFLSSDDEADKRYGRVHAFNSHDGRHLGSLKVMRDRRKSRRRVNTGWNWLDGVTSDLINGVSDVVTGTEEMEGLTFSTGVPYGDRECHLHVVVIKSAVPRKAWVKHFAVPAEELRRI